MSAYWVLENVWAYSVQFAAVAAFALLLARLARRAAPSLRMALLQLGLLLALCAPFLMVQSGPVLMTIPTGSVAIETAGAAPEVSPTLRPTTVLLACLAGGAVLRLAWTLLGLAALARKRRGSRPITNSCPELVDLRARLGVEAELLAGPAGPVAFGFFRPAVLIPETLLSGDSAALRAVLAHELIHLRRRDWLFVLAEELVVAALWFHPAAWLLVREIRLTREEAVDQQAAEAVASSRTYLDALLEVARARFQPVHGLGAEFLRERQIARRIATLIRQENPMSRRTQVSLTSLSIAALACAAWWAASLSPLVGAPQATVLAGNADLVSVSQGSEGLVLPTAKRPLYARYSLAALIGGIEGQVTLELTLDDGGNVVDARAVSGPLELRQEAVRWALDWRYDPAVQPARSLVATVSFRLPEQDPDLSFPILGLSGLMERVDFPPASLVLRSVQSGDLDPPNPALHAKLESYIGQSFGPDGSLAEAIQGDIVAATEPTGSYRATQAWIAPRADGAVLLIRRAQRSTSQPAPAAKPSVPKRIRVGGGVQKKRAVRVVQPSYPALARQAKVQGTVDLSVILSEEGAVQTVDVLSGHPLLIPAAIEAVKQWRYKPTLLNGKPVEVETTVEINFALSD